MRLRLELRGVVGICLDAFFVLVVRLRGILRVGGVVFGGVGVGCLGLCAVVSLLVHVFGVFQVVGVPC